MICAGVYGCTTLEGNPFLYDATDYPDRKQLDDDDLKLRLSFMAREMMEADDREKLLAEIYEADVVKKWGYMQTSTAVSMGADLSKQTINTPLGQDLGLAVGAIGFVFGEIKDGSMDVISQAFLPAEFRGEKLDTVEQANSALSRFTRDKIIDIARKYNWEYKCLAQCDSLNQIFSLVREKKEIDSSSYYFQPKIIVVKTLMLPMVRVENGDPVSAFAGFPVKWKSPQGNTYLVQFFSEPVLDGSNKIKILYSEDNDIYYPVARRSLVRTRIGREILNDFHSTPYTIYGDKSVHPKLFFRSERASCKERV